MTWPATTPSFPCILVAGDSIDSLNQNSTLCTIRLYKSLPNLVCMGKWMAHIMHLFNDQHLGVLTTAVSLSTYLYKKNMDDFHTCISPYVSHLSQIVSSASTDLQYYTQLLVKLLWLL
ncbi:AP-2 complex subunit alpha-1 [Myotis brandtii]|uniref:AP-2 complex subunit alpha-1 n=1 Tax=Myotis brandtii TaxID=109478 RepID=S7PCY2_MYOBR|nr:AP-2 complex subunit alpha-1 [Myotis brandtii]